ncbi:MAG: class A beta-lactamase-related serine hydrolase [Deltaproteobacteria bacterium]|nr:class A beta-lactamase-related serine hydrolase [Deltaproteobacteria bacterium]
MLSILVPMLALAAPAEPPLDAIILERDTLLFERGFNACKLDELEPLIADDFVMYHDKAGVDDRAAFFRAMRENICHGQTTRPVRHLVPGTTHVYPLRAQGKLYGALQTGEHDFYLKAPGADEVLTNIARFTHLWLLRGGKWVLKTSLSYDHQDPRSNTPFDADVLTRIYDTAPRVDAMLERHVIRSMAIARISSGVVREVRVAGERAPGKPAGLDTIYNVASLAKPVTAMTVLKLVDLGLWDLDAPLARFYVDPAVARSPHAKKLTTRHVLSHRSGLPNWRHLREDKKLVFEFAPGTRYQYSGEGYEWLRKAVEAKLERSLEDLAREYVFQPAGMRDTSYRWPDASRAERVAERFGATGEPVQAAPHREANAAANLMTTAEDYGRFLAYVMGGAGLSPKLRSAMLAPTSKKKPGIAFGLGWEIFPDVAAGQLAIQHTGGDDGLKALALGFPGTGDGVVILSNSENGMQLWRKVVTEMFGARGAEVVARNLAPEP